MGPLLSLWSSCRRIRRDNTLACADTWPRLPGRKSPLGPPRRPHRGETPSRGDPIAGRPHRGEAPSPASSSPTAGREPRRGPAAPPRGRAPSLHALDQRGPSRLRAAARRPGLGSVLPAGPSAAPFRNPNGEGWFSPELTLGGGAAALGSLAGPLPSRAAPSGSALTGRAPLRSGRGGGGAAFGIPRTRPTREAWLTPHSEGRPGSLGGRRAG